MNVAVARSINIVDTTSDTNKRWRPEWPGDGATQQLARRPNFQDTREAADAGTLYGTQEEVAAKLQLFRDIGVQYVLLNSQGGFRHYAGSLEM